MIHLDAPAQAWFKRKGNEPYPNQDDAMVQVMKCFESVHIVTLAAQMQSGKTGVAHLVMNAAITVLNIPIDNIYLMTGMSDCEWKTQSRGRVMDRFRKRVLHNPDLRNPKTMPPADLCNALLVIDECHLATGKEHTMGALFQSCGLLVNLEDMKRRRLYILCISATPGALLYDLQEWDKEHRIVQMQPADGYIGVSALFELGRIRQPFAIKTDKGRAAYLNMIADMAEPRWHLVRLADGPSRDALEEAAEEKGIRVLRHDSEERYELDKEIFEPPEKHTIVLIKGFLRAAKTLWEWARLLGIAQPYDKYVGSTHDTYSSRMDTSALMQGLLGRFCGYGLATGTLGPIHYLDPRAVQQYIDLWDSGYQYTDYDTSGLRVRDGQQTRKVETVADPVDVAGLEVVPHAPLLANKANKVSKADDEAARKLGWDIGKLAYSKFVQCGDADMAAAHALDAPYMAVARSLWFSYFAPTIKKELAALGISHKFQNPFVEQTFPDTAGGQWKGNLFGSTATNDTTTEKTDNYRVYTYEEVQGRASKGRTRRTICYHEGRLGIALRVDKRDCVTE